MKNPTISVIVPVYNVEKYLDECIQSIVSQTFKDIEIILVNDGSTDSSGLICDQWMQKDERIKVIHKKNGGLSSARNAGIDAAQGKYIIFVDSDDYWIGTDSLAHLYDTAEKFDADVVRGEYIVENEKGERINTIAKNKSVYSNKLLDSATFYINCIAGENYSWLFLFKRDAFKESRFDEDVIFLEDTDFNISFFSSQHRCIYTNIEFYIYRKRSNSILTTPRISNLSGMLNLSDVFQKYSKQCDDIQLKKEFSNKAIMYYYWTLEEMTYDSYFKQKYKIAQKICL
jgi:glycosyltransferase involved in cell wall biosynthesis